MVKLSRGMVTSLVQEELYTLVTLHTSSVQGTIHTLPHSGAREIPVIPPMVPRHSGQGKPLYEIRTQLCALMDGKYDTERLWGGGKAWTREDQYRRGGKTSRALYGGQDVGKTAPSPGPNSSPG